MSLEPQPAPSLTVTSSNGFAEWLTLNHLSLGVTTYQAGKLFLIGVQVDGKLSIFERTFNHCMGLSANGQTLWMSSLYQVWRLENALLTGQTTNSFDCVYVPRVGYTTGRLDIHDIAVEKTGRLVFVNTLFNCVATVSDRYSFTPLWRPSFISELVAEDRCHLNGLAIVDGLLKYVTSVSRTDSVDGWRDFRSTGGCLSDVTTGDVVAEGLSMPHSPRWQDGKLWLLESGSGYLGIIDIENGTFARVAFCPGYLRGLAFINGYAIVGLSKLRNKRSFAGLALDDELVKRRAQPWCGLQIIDTTSGELVHWLQIEGVVTELYDVVALPEIKRPMALGFKSDEIQRTISIGIN